MSNVSTAHDLAVHQSGVSKAFTGQRLVRVIAKKDSNGKYASEHLQATKSVSIPILPAPTPEQLAAFMPQITEMIHGFQDAIIAERAKDGATIILDSEIDMDAIGKWLAASGGSARVTKEVLQGWFMDSYAEIAVEYIATAFKWDAANLTDEQATVIEQKVNILRDMFAGFSSGKYSPDDAKCNAMIKFVTYAADNADSRMKAMEQKAQDIMQKRREETSMNALGF